MIATVDLVTLGLGREIFAVPVGCVLEIVAMRELVHVPDAPPHVAGLTEVRERAVPVIDLRRRLGLPSTEVTHQTRIIVLDVTLADRRLLVGLIADRVIEVISLQADQIGPPPDAGTRAPDAGRGGGTIAGVARHDRGFVLVFDMARLLSGAAADMAVPDTDAADEAAAARAA